MKTFKTLALAAAMPFIASCSSEQAEIPPTPNERQDIAISRSEAEIIGLQNDFSLRLFNGANLIDTLNTLISPLSTSTLLSIIANGAEGETQQEILSVLGFESTDIDAVNTLNGRLAAEFATADNTTEIAMANSIWIDGSTPANETFINDCKLAYGAEIFNSDFTHDDLDNWAAAKTNGMIKNVNCDFSAQITMVSALAFKGLWAQAFDKKDTKTEPFTNADGSVSQVRMMHGTFLCPVAYDEAGAYWLSKSYGNGAFEMITVLPDENSELSVNYYLNTLTSENFPAKIKALAPDSVDVAMPAFEIDDYSEFDLILEAMGMKKMFTPDEGEFGKITDRKGWQPGSICQQTKITVDESGTAAASIDFNMWDISAPDIDTGINEIILNRPFAFFIRERSTGAIIFAGSINKL